VAVAAAALAGMACDKVPLTAPSESTIILFANTTSIPLNGTAEISAAVTESAGTPVQNGTVVTFFTSLGTIDPPEVRTQNGKATVRLHAGSTSGLATIRAASGGNTTLDPQLSIAVGNASAARIELFATPASLPSGGGTIQLLAIVYDAGGNRLPSVQVSFATDKGTLSSNAVITDSSGDARSLLTTTLAATVTASVVSSADKTVTATVQVTLRSAPTVSIVAGTAAPTAGLPVSFTFAVAAGSAGAAVRSAVVDFGDGGSQTLGTNGTTVASHTYARAGSYTVTATATDAAGETTVATLGVTVAEPAASRVEVFATPASLPSGGGIAQILGIAYDGSGNRLPSVQMSFSTTTGTLSSNTVTTDGAGEARVLLTTTLEATVTATVVTAGDKAVTGTVKVTLRSAPTVGIVVGTATPTAGQPVSFTFNVTAGTGGAAVRTAVVSFGDGSGQTLSTTGTTVASHTYAQAGSYTVTATATDAAGESGVATAGVVVAEATPINVVLSHSPASPTTYSTVTFTTAVTPTTAPVARYEWDFGDGGTRITSGGSTTHVYDKIGLKVVRVRVVLTDGRSATAEIEIYLAT
jgi:PKD repeat protein